MIVDWPYVFWVWRALISSVVAFAPLLLVWWLVERKHR